MLKLKICPRGHFGDIQPNGEPLDEIEVSIQTVKFFEYIRVSSISFIDNLQKVVNNM